MNFSDIVDSEKIFEFVDTLRNKDSNWVYEFNTGQDIIKCLKINWLIWSMIVYV